MTDKLSNKDLVEKGFVEIPHFTIADNVIYDLGRNRTLSAGSVGTPNEMVFICESDEDDPKQITDMVCVHNYDYDGYLTHEKIDSLLKHLSWKRKV